VERVGARHDVDLPDGRTLRAIYFPAPLEVGDRVRIEDELFEVEQALTITDALRGTVVRARLKAAAGGSFPPDR
jgi:hypothetical protein